MPTSAAPSDARVPAADAPAAAPAAAIVPPVAAPAAAPAALVPAARAELIAAAEHAKAAAVAGLGKKAAAKAGAAAVCQTLRDALQRANDPRDLLDAVACPRAVSTAQRTYHELMTGEALGPRAILRAEDGAPRPTDQPEPPGGLAIFATGLRGDDAVQNALAQFLKRYAAQAIVRSLHRRGVSIILFKPTMGEKQKSLCFLMCGPPPRAPLPATPTYTPWPTRQHRLPSVAQAPS